MASKTINTQPFFNQLPKYAEGHRLAAEFYERLNTITGTLVVVFSTVVGGATFGELEATVAGNPKFLWARVAMGIASIAAAIGAALQTFFNFERKASEHRYKSSRYTALFNNLQTASPNTLFFSVSAPSRFNELIDQDPDVPTRYRKIVGL